MYRKLIKPILFAMNIERAHSTVLFLLRMIGKIPGGRALLRAMYRTEHPSLEREVFGLRFPNPIGLAAGFDRNGEAFRELSALGFGFVEIGTVTPQPQAGNPRPRIFRLPADRAIINRSGLNNKGLYKAIAQLRHRHDRLIIGGNIGKNTLTQPSQVAADYLKMFRNLYQYVDYFSINVCCDNCADGSVSHNKAHLMNILQPLFDFRRGQNQYRPILLKISPDLPDPLIDEVTDLMLSTPLDGIVAVNGTFSRKGLETDEETLDEIGSGRLSGAPLTQRAIEVVRRIHRRSHGAYPIIGVGGLMNARDVKAMLAAGASLVHAFAQSKIKYLDRMEKLSVDQTDTKTFHAHFTPALYTGYIYEGPSLVKEICRALIDDAASEASASPAPGK